MLTATHYIAESPLIEDILLSSYYLSTSTRYSTSRLKTSKYVCISFSKTRGGLLFSSLSLSKVATFRSIFESALRRDSKSKCWGPIKNEIIPMFSLLFLGGTSGIICVCKIFIPARTNPVKVITIAIMRFSQVNLMIYRVKSQAPGTVVSSNFILLCRPKHGLQSSFKILAPFREVVVRAKP